MSWPTIQPDEVAPVTSVPWIGELNVRDRIKYRWDGADYTGHIVGIDKHCAINVIGEDALIEIQLDKTGVFRTHLSKLVACNLRRSA